MGFLKQKKKMKRAMFVSSVAVSFCQGIMWQFYNLSTSLSTFEQNVIDIEFNHVNNWVFSSRGKIRHQLLQKNNKIKLSKNIILKNLMLQHHLLQFLP